MAKRRPKNRKATNGQARQSAAVPPERALQGLRSTFAKQARGLAARSDRFSQLLSRTSESEFVGQYLVPRSSLSEKELAELKSLTTEANAALRTELREATERLRNLLTLGDPLYIATRIMLTNLAAPWGSYYEPTHEGSEAKVELVVGLLATQPIADNLDRPTAQEMQQIYDEIDHVLGIQVPLNVSMWGRDDVDAAALRYASALSWMILRGSSYGNHGRDLALAVYGPHDEWTLGTFGFTINDVLGVGAAAESLMNTRLNDLLGRAGEFADGVMKELRSPEMKGRLIRRVRRRMTSRKGELHVRGRALIDIVEPSLRDAMAFTVDDICATNVDLDRSRVEAVLGGLSIAVGSLSPKDYTGLFDKSPLVERPYLQFKGDYVLASPGMVLRDPIALLEQRFIERKAEFTKARAKALDRLAVKYLSDMLPGSTTFTNLYYDDAELDGLVLFDDIAFVVEGKGGALSVPAKRGDVKRLRSEMKDSVQEAWDQGARARDYILSGKDAPFRNQRGEELVRIPSGAVTEVFIINPTLHELGGHAPQLARLRALGLFPEAELPWSVFINDLRVISETCDNAAIFLHYLAWRNRLPLGERVTVSDEIDLWGCYLNCERFGMLAGGGKAMLGNSTVDFDSYYHGLLGHGPKRDPPRRFSCEPIGSFVDRMASERPPGWRVAAGACLDLSIPELAVICSQAESIATLASKKGQAVWHRIGRVALVGLAADAVIATAIEQSDPDSDGATLVIYCQKPSAEPAQIVWAKYAKPVTFELSDYERAAFGAVHGQGMR